MCVRICVPRDMFYSSSTQADENNFSLSSLSRTHNLMQVYDDSRTMLNVCRVKQPVAVR